MVGEKMEELEKDVVLDDPSGVNPKDETGSTLTIETEPDGVRVNEDLSIAPPVKTEDIYPAPHNED